MAGNGLGVPKIADIRGSSLDATTGGKGILANLEMGGPFLGVTKAKYHNPAPSCGRKAFSIGVWGESLF